MCAADEDGGALLWGFFLIWGGGFLFGVVATVLVYWWLV